MTKKTIEAHDSVLDLVGNTPLIKLNETVKRFQGSYYAKAEFTNPGHSNKDRIAQYIIEEAERNGILKPGNTVIETTSGNTGFSVAMASIIKDIIVFWLLLLNHLPIKLICFVLWELQFMYALVM